MKNTRALGQWGKLNPLFNNILPTHSGAVSTRVEILVKAFERGYLDILSGKM